MSKENALIIFNGILFLIIFIGSIFFSLFIWDKEKADKHQTCHKRREIANIFMYTFLGTGFFAIVIFLTIIISNCDNCE